MGTGKLVRKAKSGLRYVETIHFNREHVDNGRESITQIRNIDAEITTIDNLLSLHEIPKSIVVKKKESGKEEK